ncbi:galactoside alpha-(1,2)-fucosyltransferase 2-like [Ruditapes philippinarum]|uniref:galactoside alpha-(1,2)-fucosyltransferase 2-like n=1 Tax=Ruditapes philippinarum TaxID=129788 RepID=UPI00295A8BA6|nr:galactoside alpha-(1,2)-fucosyltransferase 2-like [Ruditapes philippinarum]
MQNIAKFSFADVLLVASILFLVILLELDDKDRALQRTKVQTLHNLPSFKPPEVYYSPVNVLCVSFQGRLGNLMFQYASGFGIARQKNMTLRISKHDQIAKVFNTSAQKVHCKEYCQNAFKKFESIHCAYDPQLLNFTQIFVKLHTYLQSWKYFKSVTNSLRQELKFNDHIRATAEKIFHIATKKAKFYGQNSTYVGVHIRRGDMFYGQIKNESRISDYNIAPITYIENAMAYFKKRFPRVTFVICSDDIRWVLWRFGRYQKLLNLVFVHKKPEVDLAVLSMCNHTIMTTGTFGWWASWLAGGTTVYYKNYVKEDSVLRQQFSSDFSDFFYPGWIPME